MHYMVATSVKISIRIAYTYIVQITSSSQVLETSSVKQESDSPFDMDDMGSQGIANSL